MASIHQTAIIDSQAEIADDVEIGPYSIIEGKVSIDSGSHVGAHVVIKGPTSIGKNNRIHQFASIGDISQALGETDEDTYLEIGDGNIFREYCTVNRGSTKANRLTKIGHNNLLMAYTHVAHDCILGDHIVFSNAASIAGHVEVGDYVRLGGFTTVHQFIKIGAHSFSGLSSVINRDVPPYVIIAGNHADAYGINKEGLKRRDFSSDAIRALHKAYMALIKARQPQEQALASIQDLIAKHPEVEAFATFIQSSERGVVRSP